MSQKSHKLVLVRGYSEAYYQLSEAEKAELWERVSTAIRQADAKMSTPYYTCRWANDKYGSYFIMEYPSVEAAMADTSGVEEAQLFRYMSSETIWGVDTGTTLP